MADSVKFNSRGLVSAGYAINIVRACVRCVRAWSIISHIGARFVAGY